MPIINLKITKWSFIILDVKQKYNLLTPVFYVKTTKKTSTMNGGPVVRNDPLFYVFLKRNKIYATLVANLSVLEIQLKSTSYIKSTSGTYKVVISEPTFNSGIITLLAEEF